MILRGLNNEQYVTGRELGRGGEGTVFELQDDGSLVLKLYNEPLAPEKADKLRRMVALRSPGIEAYAAWPVGLATDDKGEICGFVMKKLSGYVPMHMIFSPMDRKKLFPDKGYNFLVHVARNLATAFFKLHEAGLVVGDVNEGNILINASGLVAFIDCDSFQVKGDDSHFFCEVGVPRYTPPELLKQGTFENVVRTVNTDSFSMAVLLFQLLFMGRHPFAGRNHTANDLDEETAIRQRQFAYSLDNKRKKLTPPNNSFPITHLPDGLVALFHQAFEQDTRPLPAEWIKALDGMLGDMLTCNISKLHSYPAKLQECPWCYFKNRAGILYFMDDSYLHIHAATGNIDSFINGFRLEKMEPRKWVRGVAHLNLSASPIPGQFREYKRIKDISTILALGGSIGLLFVLGWNIWSGLIFIIGALGYFVFAKRISAELNKRINEFKTHKGSMDYLVREYEQLNEVNVYNEGVGRLEKLVQEFRKLPEEFERRKKVMEERIYNRQLDEYLAEYPIEHFTIPSFGPQKKAALIEGGIKTAADISRLQNIKIAGIGPKNLQILLDWRRQMATGFVYIPDDTAIAAGLLHVNGEVANLRTFKEAAIRKEYQTLNYQRQTISNRTTLLEKHLGEVSLKTYQAELEMVVFRKFAT